MAHYKETEKGQGLFFNSEFAGTNTARNIWTHVKPQSDAL